LLQYYCGVGHQGLDELDAEMVAIAKAIIAQRTGNFDPTTYRDRYQAALYCMDQRPGEVSSSASTFT